MPRTNKKILGKNVKEEIWQSLFESLKKARNGSDFEKIMSRLLPDDERTMFEKRLLISRLLDQGVPIREIGRRMSVTRRTITFLRSGFKQRSSGKGR
jgi:Trp operon repressor